MIVVLVDSWAMGKGDFYVGGYFSTMSETVCHWRGYAKRKMSNLCFLANRLYAKEPLF